jgi:predicted Zn finger-like uncharacterized protein
MTDGTARCPHCNTRFRIAEAQLEAHQGMVRCGRCLQAFDAHPSFIPDQPAPQLELLIPDAQVEYTDVLTAEETGTAHFLDNETPGFNQPLALAEQAAIMPNGYRSTAQPKRRIWPWTIAALLLLLVLLAQAAYFFRIELAARLPGLKPALIGYCRLLQCSVPLPQKTDLMSIESSGLEADPTNENQITLNALLRNRAGYAQAFPCLELTLNDSQDKPLARRSFRPSEYLPPLESESTGLLPSRELSIKLHLNTTGLKPMGYRLVLYYPAG